MSDTNLNPGIQKNELVTLAQNRLDDVCVTAFNYPALIIGNKMPYILDAILDRASLRPIVKCHFIKRKARGWVFGN